MSKVFIKIEAHTDKTSIPYFNNLFSHSDTKIDVNLVPNVWYDVNALFKFVGNDLAKSNLLSNVKAFYKIAQPYFNYELKALYAYYYPTKEDADNKTNLITSTILRNKTNVYKDNGEYTPLTKTGEPYDIDLNADKTVAIVYHVGDPNSKVTNPPYVHYEKTYSSYLGIRTSTSSSAVHVYDRYHDITTSSVNREVEALTLLKNLPSPQQFLVYINGKKDSSGILSKANDSIPFSRTLQFNDKVDFYLPSEVPTPKTQPVHVVHPENIIVTPTELPLAGGKLNIKAKDNFIITGYHVFHTGANSEEDWTKEDQNINVTELNFDVPKFDYASEIDVSVDTQTTLPVYYNLPTIAHVTFSPNKAELGKKTTITVTPDSGYTINKLTFFADNENIGGRIFTSSYKNGIIDLDLTSYNKDDLDWANQTIEHSEKIELNAPVYYVLPTIDHVTFEPTKIEYGKLTNVKVTPETGYIINSIHFEATNPNTLDKILNTSYQNGYIKFDLTNISKSQSSQFEQLIIHSEDVKKLEYGTYVLPKITGITFTLNGSPVTSIQLGTYYNFGIELDSHYSFSDDKGKGFLIKNGDGTTTNLSIWNGNKTLGVHFENYTTADQLKNAYWDINVQKTDHSDEHEKQVPIQLELTHATADKTTILENSTDTITLTADAGYIFDDDIVYYSFDINYGIYHKLTEKANKQNTIKIDLTTGSFYDYDKSKDNPISSGNKPYIKAVATSPTVKPTGTKSISLYSMTDGELNTFMNSVLLQFNSSPDGTQTSLANFLDFVNQIYRIPLNIPNNLLKPVNKIHSGNWNINVNTNQITQDHFSINFEPIKVEPHYKNANDYNSITVSLVIPFAKEVELNINDIMNNTIKITYNIDLLQGKTTIIVSNDTGTIYTNQIDISTQLEFYGLYYDKTIGGLNSTYINNVLQPYIIISYHKPIINLISYSTNEHGMLKDYNGFVRVSHGTLTGNMNDTEYNEIMNLLYGGIKIGTKGN